MRACPSVTRFFPFQRRDRFLGWLQESGSGAAGNGRNHALRVDLRISELLEASRACGRARDLEFAKKIQLEAPGSNIFLASSLVDMFAKCHSMADACSVFYKMPCHNVVCWTALLLGYVDTGCNTLALDVFEGIPDPDALSFVAAMVACANLATSTDDHLSDHKKIHLLQRGMDLHSRALRAGYDESNGTMANTVISMYAKCGSLLDARMAFDRAPQHTVVSWNALIAGCVDNGEAELGLELFWCMIQDGYQQCFPDSRTFVAALTACGTLVSEDEGIKVDGRMVKLKSLEKVMAVHGQASRSGHTQQVYVASSIVNLYAKCGSMIDSSMVFSKMATQDIVSWTSLILGYGENGEGEIGLQLFHEMRSQGCCTDGRTYVAVLRACADCGDKDEDVTQVDGRLVKARSLETVFSLHSQAIRDGFAGNIFVATSLVDVYAKCGSLLDARVVFDKMHSHNLVSWNALMLAYAENGDAELALEMFSRMGADQGCIDSRGFIAALVAAGNLVALERGRGIHREVLRFGLETNMFVANCLVDFYAKCASMSRAYRVFDSMSGNNRNLVTWSTLMGGYSRHGDAGMVFMLFEMLKDEEHQGDSITFLALLTACSHAGLVQRGKRYFQELLSLHQQRVTKVTVQHYDCMVDLLGRGNHLDEAVNLVMSMPYKPNLVTWNAILGACRKWKNIEVGRLAFNKLVELNQKQASTYLTMASIYGNAGMWEEQAAVLSMKRAAKPWKEPGVSSWTDHLGVVHRFRAGDSCHAQREAVGIKLKELLIGMKKAGYVAEVSSVASNISDCEKEEALCEHSERLAIACALINTASGAEIRIVKNLRVCDDCHQAAALISKIEQRRIICRDSSRFHIFEAGKCSCRGFW